MNLLKWLQPFPPALSFTRSVFSSWNLFMYRSIELPTHLLCHPNPLVLPCLWYPCPCSHIYLQSECQSTAQGKKTSEESCPDWAKPKFSSLRHLFLICVNSFRGVPQKVGDVPLMENQFLNLLEGDLLEKIRLFFRETENVATTGFPWNRIYTSTRKLWKPRPIRESH